MRIRHAASVLLAAGLALSLTACSGARDEPPPTATPATAPPTPTATAAATATSMPTPTATTTPTPTATTAPTATPAASSPTATPTAIETPSPSPTAEAAATGLRYNANDTTGEVAEPGSYAFLADAGDTTSAVTTYEALRDGTTTALLIHKSDAHGASQAALYDAVEAGDLLEWHEADDCFVRYRVTEVKPDPTGAVPRKLLAVEWMTYAFTGCSGAVSANAVATVDWGELPDLGGTSLASPVRHGIFQVVPENWTGAIDPGETHELPEGAPPYPGPYAETLDVTVARGFPYWREPELPAGWTFSHAYRGGMEIYYGYCATYAAADGYVDVKICATALWGTGTWQEDASWLTDAGSDGLRAGARETRWISGRPALVQYSPQGPGHHPAGAVWVWVYDAATQSIYTVMGLDPSLRGSNTQGVIAIAGRLFESPNPP